MFQALAFKELRETGRIGGLVFAFTLLVVLDQCGFEFDGWQRVLVSVHKSAPLEAHAIPFVYHELNERLVLIAVCGALVMGAFQALSEAVRRTWPFLLHRPISRTAMTSVKLAAGGLLLVLAMVLPLLAGALWAATPGTHAAPFDWRMTLQPLRIIFSATTLYLAAYLCGLRDARWYGSRLLPLAPAGIVMTWVFVMTWFPLSGWIVVLVADAAYLAAIFETAHEREYA